MLSGCPPETPVCNVCEGPDCQGWGSSGGSPGDDCAGPHIPIINLGWTLCKLGVCLCATADPVLDGESCTVWEEASGECTRPPAPSDSDCTIWQEIFGGCHNEPPECDKSTTDEACAGCKVNCLARAGCPFGGRPCTGALRVVALACIRTVCQGGPNPPCGAYCPQVRELPPGVLAQPDISGGNTRN